MCASVRRRRFAGSRSRQRSPASSTRWTTLNIDLERLLGFAPRVIEVLSTRYYPSDLGYVAQPQFLGSVLQTLQMSLLGGAAGMSVALPLAWLGSYNLSPLPGLGAWTGRAAIMSARAIHETIWTILFVMILGFGMLSGMLALTMFCIGFAGKLLSDEVEAIDMGPIEALRAAGAGPLQVFQHAALPQLRVAFAGIGLYTWDVAFRVATVVGFFGGGGMGLYLKQTVHSSTPTGPPRSCSSSSASSRSPRSARPCSAEPCAACGEDTARASSASPLSERQDASRAS